jgi:hypothetical protein
VACHGKPVKKINKSFRTARRLAGLGDDVVRHTCGTWIAMSGTAKGRDAAEYLGITEEVFERVYGHHCPDHQAAAVASFSFKPMAKRTKRRNQTWPKVEQNRQGSLIFLRFFEAYLVRDEGVAGSNPTTPTST